MLFILLGVHVDFGVDEIGEIADDMENAGEYADVLQALMELAALNNVPWIRVETERQNKEKRSGGFAAGRMLMVHE